MITRARLLELLDYNPATGIFRWKASTNQRIKPGSIAGCCRHEKYWWIRLDGRSYSAGRLAWLYVYGNWPLHQIDHINRVKTDNRIGNLRDVPDGVNKLNMDRSAVKRNKQGRFT
jgi:hypothetical protein